MANLFTQSQIESILGLKPGQATGGYAQNLINSDPTAAAKYNAAVRAVTQPGASSVTMGSQGVVPMSVEPLNPAERTGYSSLAQGVDISGIQNALNSLSGLFSNPQGFASQFTSPESTAALKQAQELITRGTTPISDVSSYFNPYMQDMQGLLDEYGQRAANKLQANLPGSRSFGSISQGVQLSNLARDLLNSKTQLQYQGYNDAFSRASEAANRDIQGAQALQGNASTGQNIFSNAAQIGQGGATSLGNLAQQLANAQITNAQNQITTGQNIRNYNQGVANQVAGNVAAQQGYGLNQLQNLGALLSKISGQSGMEVTGSTPSTLQTLGGLAGLAGEAYNKYQQPQQIQPTTYGTYTQQGPRPWQTPGAIYPVY